MFTVSVSSKVMAWRARGNGFNYCVVNIFSLIVFNSIEKFISLVYYCVKCHIIVSFTFSFTGNRWKGIAAFEF